MHKNESEICVLPVLEELAAGGRSELHGTHPPSNTSKRTKGNFLDGPNSITQGIVKFLMVILKKCGQRWISSLKSCEPPAGGGDINQPKYMLKPTKSHAMAAASSGTALDGHRTLMS
jgi:hypothetical protein